jgi:hypothetical protein
VPLPSYKVFTKRKSAINPFKDPGTRSKWNYLSHQEYCGVSMGKRTKNKGNVREKIF